MINTREDLERIAPGTDHVLRDSGAYCLGSFTLEPGHRITVPTGLKVELRGHGTHSVVTGSIDGAVLVLQDGCTVHAHDFKITNVRTQGAPRAVDSATTEAYFVNVAVFINDGATKIGEGIRVTGGRFFATQLRVSDCITGVSCRGGEVFLMNYDCEDVTHGVSVDASHDGLQWVGGRINAYGTTGLRVGADIQSIVLQGVTAVTSSGNSDFVRWTAGKTDRATIMGNTLFGDQGARGINWDKNHVPELGLALVGNTLRVATPLVGIDHRTAKVNSKANVAPTGLMKETAIVT